MTRLAAVPVVLVFAGIYSVMAWQALAGQHIPIGHPVATSSTGTDAPKISSTARSGTAKVRRRTSAGEFSTPVDHAQTSAPAGSTPLSGTFLAVGVIAVIIGVALLAVRMLLRRRHRPGRDRDQVGQVDHEHACVPNATCDPVPSETPAELPRTQSADAREPLSTAASTLEAPPDHPSTLSSSTDPALLSTPPDAELPTRATSPRVDEGEQRHPFGSAPQDHRSAGADSLGIADPRDSSRVLLFERRTALRVAYSERARLQWDGNDVACRTADLSTTGSRCLLASPGPCPRAGAEVRVTLMLGQALGVFSARVAWSSSEGGEKAVGLEFVKVDAHQRSLLEKTLRTASRA